jgi:adenylate cyclase
MSSPSVTFNQEKRKKWKKKVSQPTVPLPPPPKNNGLEFAGDLSLDSMDGIIDFTIASSGLSPSDARDSGSLGALDSHLDSSFNHHILSLSEFSDPFSKTSVQDKRKDIITQGDYRKVPPKTMLPPHWVNGTPFGGIAADSLSTGPGSPTWVPPESWAVEEGAEDPYNNPELSEPQESCSDSEADKRRAVECRSMRNGRRVRHPHSASFTSVPVVSPTSGSSRATIRLNPAGCTFKMKIFGQNSTYHAIAIDPDSTVANLMDRLNKKMLEEEDNA